MVNLRCPVCAGALEKRAGAYLCPKNHSFDIAKSGYVNLLLNSSQGHHGDDKLMVRARRDFLDKGYYDRFIAAVADAAARRRRRRSSMQAAARGFILLPFCAPSKKRASTASF